MLSEGQLASLQLRVGKVGVWLTRLGLEPARNERTTAQVIENLGYRTLWIGETLGNKEALSHASLLLSSTRNMTIATGIANIWVRDASAMNSASNTLNEAFDNRFLLGLGVSHKPLVQARGHEYGRPLQAMEDYLNEMDRAEYFSARPSEPPIRVLAALRTKMLDLARERSGGAHTYFVTPLHTQRSREILGPTVLLAPEQAFIIDKSPISARALARAHMKYYLTLPNYLNNLKDLGFVSKDFQDGGSNRLVDSIVAWGNIESVIERIREHIQAGADHVAVQPLCKSGDIGLDALTLLAPAVNELMAE